MEIQEFDSLEALQAYLASEVAAVVYFSTPQCNVCKVLKPKVAALLEKSYPEMGFVYSDVAGDAETAAQLGVLTVPTLIVYFDGRETARFVRTFGMGELQEAIARPYEMLFG